MKRFTRKLLCIGLMLAMLSFSAQAVFALAKININKATVAELVVLKGVGEKTAANIVEYRDAHGPFMAIGDIVNVKGVGEKIFSKLSDQITVADEVAQK